MMVIQTHTDISLEEAQSEVCVHEEFPPVTDIALSIRNCSLLVIFEGSVKIISLALRSTSQQNLLWRTPAV